MAIQRGEIYWLEWSPGRGSEQQGIRPALVIQNDVGNRTSATTIVATITSRVERVYPFMVRLEPDESGLPVASLVNLSQLLTVAQARLLPPRSESTLRPVSRLGGETMALVDRALRISLGL